MCKKENNQDIKLEMKTVLELFEYNFFIPSYQRGYRWTENEVSCLLDDIYANKDKNYCLQPVVVKKRNDNFYELIDGQQRITTLFILLQYIEKTYKIPFELKTELEYETRPKSTDFIKEIAKDTKNTDDNNSPKPDDNIDFFHMHTAITTIAEWFNDKNNFQDQSKQLIAAFEIFVALSKTVKVIWYEIGENEDATSLFTRLNIGKIPLTNAELVKALFLADSNESLSESKKQEIAYQWDTIEKELHDKIFWNFLAKDGNYQTRIDLVLNLAANSENKNKYDTFFYFDENKSNLSELWDKIVQIFYLLKEWYEDIELFHKIGYLITSGSSNLLALYNRSKNKTKSDFKTALTEEIEKSIGNITDIDEFSYADNWNYTKNLLLLFNIETIRQANNDSYRFPFHTYNKLIWSIEHIHAQNSEELPEVNWKDWLSDHKNYFESKQDDNSKKLLKEIEEAQQKLEDETLTSNEFNTLQNTIFNSFSDKNETKIHSHSIGNLALLSKDKNSSLNNSIFPIKRDKIIKMDMDKDGTFVPPCTKNVFLKYYTPSEKEQVDYWGLTDGEAYKNEIKETLKEYLSNQKEGKNNE